MTDLMRELELIRRIQERLSVQGDRVLRASGDDAAVVRASGVAVTSVDVVVEDVHFELATHSPGDVGHKAIAAALSDLAAVGAGAGGGDVAPGRAEGVGGGAAPGVGGA